jgi:hypothetical protein
MGTLAAKVLLRLNTTQSRMASQRSSSGPTPLHAGAESNPHLVAGTETTRSTARNANARSVSLLRSNADRIEGEWTSSRTRVTVAASGRLYAGGRFCDRKVCATLMASTIVRSELMRKKRTRNASVPVEYTPDEISGPDAGAGMHADG